MRNVKVVSCLVAMVILIVTGQSSLITASCADLNWEMHSSI